ncbi:MAG: YceI family protein [Weeksellaceae bacterium]
MRHQILSKVILVIVFLASVQFTFAQRTFQLQTKPELVISGTSTLHDWSMPSSTATGTMSAVESGGKLTAINSMKITMPAESIKSGKRGMDKKAYEALKTDKHKNVEFTLNSATKSGNTWTLNGTFNIAGVSKSVSLKAQESSSGGVISLKGDYSFKLSDYKITPPVALMGTVKTGDAVKMTFDVKFK